MKLTGSQIDRAMVCAPSPLLPWVHRITEAATRGHNLHDFICDAGSFGRDAALERAPEGHREWYGAVLDGIETLGLKLDGLAQEVAIVWDALDDHAVEVSRGGDRDYPTCGPFQIPGTLDAVGVTEDAVMVIDWKGGRTMSEWQLKFYALAACRAYGKDKAVAMAVFLREDGSAVPVVRRMDCFDLALIAEQLRSMLGRVAAAKREMEMGRTPDVTEGEHCTYCPAFQACPAKSSLIRSAVAAPVSFAEALADMSPAGVGETMAKVIVAQQALAKLRAEIEGLVRETGKSYPLPDGRRLEMVRGRAQERIVDHTLASEILAKLFSPAVALMCVEPQTSKAAIKRGLKAATPMLTGLVNGTNAYDVAIDTLRENGALAKTQGAYRVEVVGASVPRPLPAAAGESVET